MTWHENFRVEFRLTLILAVLLSNHRKRARNQMNTYSKYIVFVTFANGARASSEGLYRTEVLGYPSAATLTPEGTYTNVSSHQAADYRVSTGSEYKTVGAREVMGVPGLNTVGAAMLEYSRFLESAPAGTSVSLCARAARGGAYSFDELLSEIKLDL
jgi:hypothetical protein